MNIEIIEFYPIEKKGDYLYLTGTLRVKLPDLGIHKHKIKYCQIANPLDIPIVNQLL